MNHTTNFNVLPWVNTTAYEKFDIVWEQGGTYRFFYATQSSQGQNPTGLFVFPIYEVARQRDEATVYFHYTGNTPYFAPGSIIKINDISPASNLDTFNYTGMVHACGSGWVKFVSAGGIPGSFSVTANIRCTNPAWTTGFMFVPAYSTTLETQQNIIATKFSDGYSQRQRAGLNPSTQTFQLVFDKRSDNEAKAIFNMIEDKGGVEAVKLLMPVSRLQNNPSLQYIVFNPKLTTVYYDINDITVTAQQVFDL